MDRYTELLRTLAQPELQMSYKEVSFPVLYAEGELSFTNPADPSYPIPFTLTRDGVNYIFYRLGAYSKQKSYVDTDLARDMGLQEFVKYINECYTLMQTDNSRESNREMLIAALCGNRLLGLMTSYNPVSHKDVVKLIKDAELELKITRTLVSPKEMEVFIKNERLGTIPADFGLVIKNGETGHVALSYNAGINIGNYMYSWPLRATRRHLSQVDKGIEALQAALQGCNTVQLNNVLRNVSTKDFKLSSKNEELEQLIISFREAPISKLIARISYFLSGYGKATATKALLNQIFKQAKDM